VDANFRFETENSLIPEFTPICFSINKTQKKELLAFKE